jgi:hypothetical protein
MKIELMRDKGKVMPDIDKPEAVKSAQIWHCNYISLQELNKCLNLEILEIATMPEADFNFISNCKKLKYLSVVHLPKVSELTSLDKLISLEVISLQTLPSWDSSGKVQTVKSLKPLAQLPNLKHLELFGVRPESKSPADLARSVTLRSVRLSKYDKKAVNEFYKSTGISDKWAPEPVYAN